MTVIPIQARRRDIGRLVADLEAADAGGYSAVAGLLLRMVGSYVDEGIPIWQAGTLEPIIAELRIQILRAENIDATDAYLLAALVYCGSAVKAVLDGDEALADVLITRGNKHLQDAIN